MFLQVLDQDCSLLFRIDGSVPHRNHPSHQRIPVFPVGSRPLGNDLSYARRMVASGAVELEQGLALGIGQEAAQFRLGIGLLGFPRLHQR